MFWRFTGFFTRKVGSSEKEKKRDAPSSPAPPRPPRPPRGEESWRLFSVDVRTGAAFSWLALLRTVGSEVGSCAGVAGSVSASALRPATSRRSSARAGGGPWTRRFRTLSLSSHSSSTCSLHSGSKTATTTTTKSKPEYAEILPTFGTGRPDPVTHPHSLGVSSRTRSTWWPRSMC